MSRSRFLACVLACILPLGLSCTAASAADAPRTERQYLSGHGPKDAVPWEFSVTGGRRAGEWTSIPVPSQWQQHGFGSYDYGGEPPVHAEHGLYRLHFAVPPSWQGKRVRLVFEGVMTEATVKVNGVLAGPTHVGGYYRFRYDVTPLVKFGAAAANLLEVDVAKRATDPLTNVAETYGDYWVFGGIFRPVWLEASPARAIDHVAIDARADGSLAAKVRVDGAAEGGRILAQVVDAAGHPVGAPMTASVARDGETLLQTKFDAPHLWTAETPNLYTLALSLVDGGEVLHETRERFGFRSFEVRKGDGLYLNGQRILIKGVNRHSFRPETGRALDPEDSYADARLIKQMNMNTARMSHYPPDPAFLEAADELGLYVLDELSGWQHAHGTEIGRRLVREMVERDVNHPSILFWDNGNEGGWNRELDGDFALYDPQRRPVLHPWELHDGVDTKHYPNWELLTKRLRGPNLLMPTEFLHGLYDGGAGASFNDYWKAITASPYGAGGIFWVFADEGVMRTDQGGRVDVFSTYAPDGIVGPHHEKEASFYTIRQIWSPVQIDTPANADQAVRGIAVHNGYDFRSLADCRFEWQLLRYPGPRERTREPQVLAKGAAAGPAVAPHASGVLDLRLPPSWQASHADALAVTAYGPDGASLWTWTIPAAGIDSHGAGPAARSQGAPRVDRSGSRIVLAAGSVRAVFDARTGLLERFSKGAHVSALSNGPRLVFARPPATQANWLAFASDDAAAGLHRLASAQMANVLEIEPAFSKSVSYARFKLELSPDGKRWNTIFDGSRAQGNGKRYSFPPQQVLAVRLTQLADQTGKPLALNALRIGYEAERFPPLEAALPAIRTGVERRDGQQQAFLETRGGAGLDHARWSMRGDGSLQLDYAYTLDGRYLYHGITFDHPEAAMRSLRWLGQGPYRVWQNRLQGTWLGVHEIAANQIQPGEAFGYPEFQGMFAGVRWARLAADQGSLLIENVGDPAYLRVGTPRISHEKTSVEFPAGGLSWLHAIPAMGAKFNGPELLGPSGEPATAAGSYHGSIRFRVLE
jgi:hypothetical protein